jgi:hypothetical protein
MDGMHSQGEDAAAASGAPFPLGLLAANTMCSICRTTCSIQHRMGAPAWHWQPSFAPALRAQGRAKEAPTSWTHVVTSASCRSPRRWVPRAVSAVWNAHQADWSKMTARTAGFGPRGEFYSPCPQQRQPSPGMQQKTDSRHVVCDTHGYARVAYNGRCKRGVQPDGRQQRARGMRQPRLRPAPLRSCSFRRRRATNVTLQLAGIRRRSTLARRPPRRVRPHHDRHSRRRRRWSWARSRHHRRPIRSRARGWG